MGRVERGLVGDRKPLLTLRATQQSARSEGLVVEDSREKRGGTLLVSVEQKEFCCKGKNRNRLLAGKGSDRRNRDVSFKKFFIIYLLLATLGLCCCTWAFYSCWGQASHCGGFACCRAQALGSWALVAAAHGNLPTRDRTVSSALAGGLPTTGLLGKSRDVSMLMGMV